MLNTLCTPAWMVTIESGVSDTAKVPYKKLLGSLANEKQLFVDESPSMENKRKV